MERESLLLFNRVSYLADHMRRELACTFCGQLKNGYYFLIFCQE